MPSWSDIGKPVPFAATAPKSSDEGDAVTIIVAANLRSALKLPGKLRRTRCFVADGADDGQVRAAKGGAGFKLEGCLL